MLASTTRVLFRETGDGRQAMCLHILAPPSYFSVKPQALLGQEFEPSDSKHREWWQASLILVCTEGVAFPFLMLEWFCAPSQLDTGEGHQDSGRDAVRLRLRLSLPSKEVPLGSTLCNGITQRYHSKQPPEKCISAGVLQPCSVIIIIYLSVTHKALIQNESIS